MTGTTDLRNHVRGESTVEGITGGYGVRLPSYEGNEDVVNRRGGPLITGRTSY